MKFYEPMVMGLFAHCFAVTCGNKDRAAVSLALYFHMTDSQFNLFDFLYDFL